MRLIKQIWIKKSYFATFIEIEKVKRKEILKATRNLNDTKLHITEDSLEFIKD